MNKTLIINKIIEYYNFKTDAKFAKFLGMKPQALSNWKARNTYDAELLYTKCVHFNAEWILSGEGEMLKENNKANDDNTKLKELEQENNSLKKRILHLEKLNDLLEKQSIFNDFEKLKKSVFELQKDMKNIKTLITIEKEIKDIEEHLKEKKTIKKT